MKIYVPVQDINDYSCYIIYDSNTIRAYDSIPHLGDNYYTDFYLSSHYLPKSSSQVIESSVELPLCLDNSVVTNDYFYRLDLAHIVIIVMFFMFFIFLTIKVFSRMFGRWLKL